MSAVAKSIYYFSFYLLGAGIALFFFPNPVLLILQLPTTSDIWVHLVGALTFILGIFFCYMAYQEARSFYFVSMFGRGIFILSIITLILFYNAPIPLILFAAVDAVGLLWTLFAYRSTK